MEKMEKLTTDIILVFLSLVLISMLSSYLQYGHTSLFGYRLFLVVSESMENTIHVGDIVVGKMLVDEEPEVNGIYAYEREGYFGKEIIIHRIVEITEDGYVFKGDANSLPDEIIVSRNKIIYRIVWKSVNR